MKYVPPIIAFLALLFVMALPQQRVQGAGDMVETIPQKPDAPVAVTSTPTPIVTATAVPNSTPTPPPNPQLACLRINFEVSGDVAQAGTYEVREVGGRSLASWSAQAGWQDSGWIRNLEISFDAVHVRVIFHPTDGSPNVTMSIYNPAPGTEYGWVARGMCHAVEVGWP
ncbi:hypothetical protein [Candidatus Leptofilum sp.]|uniref:hypothetical protein n=1 Tax=Candidatus Leptofilum sp. TaxID=3241576 RepID=UPI003B5CF152